MLAAVAVRVGVYARISSDREGDQLGVRRQIEDCKRLALQRGWEVADVYVDDDISAWSGKRRPGYELLLDDLRLRRIDGVVVWHIDRLLRHPRDLEAFLDLCDEAGTDKLGCVTGEVDLGSHTGRLTARMLGGLARYESDHKSERILRKHEELALAGKISGGGSRPFGYEADKLTVRPDEAAVIRDCATKFLAGASIRAICTDLNQAGVVTATGGEWTPQSLRRMLGSARISGQRERRGEIVATAQWPAIITPAQTARIRATLADPERRTNKTARRYLLVRLLRCGLCGESLVARPRSGGQRRYACARGPGLSGCGHVYINADQVEAFVVEAVLWRLDSPELTAALRAPRDEPDAERLQHETEDAQAQLTELADAYGNKLIGLPEWLAARKPIEARLTAARKQLAKASRTSALEDHLGDSAGLRERWQTLDLTRQRAIVAAVLDHTTVAPGRPGYNKFDPQRLTPVWRA